MSFGFQKPYPLFACPSGDGHNWVLANELIYIAKDGTQYKGIVGGTTDGASTPQAIWNIYPPFGKYWLAAILHDLAYRSMLCKLINDNWVRVQISFDEANSLLLEAMESLSVDEFTKNIIYEAVKKVGQDAFSDDLAQPIKI
jgi:hypothetical protein